MFMYMLVIERLLFLPVKFIFRECIDFLQQNGEEISTYRVSGYFCPILIFVCVPHVRK